ncbi:unnamed protein product [Periconia digitata]|uniref:Uncharacterized protein n=1 Tax=Periconia digitata TaxID=1303443 RepID=A0A9W4XP35_9PLEO|nr:unnamed protein product [Periconia digitata]
MFIGQVKRLSSILIRISISYLKPMQMLCHIAERVFLSYNLSVFKQYARGTFIELIRRDLHTTRILLLPIY